jgi:hypothetical protein
VKDFFRLALIPLERCGGKKLKNGPKGNPISKNTQIPRMRDGLINLQPGLAHEKETKLNNQDRNSSPSA